MNAPQHTVTEAPAIDFCAQPEDLLQVGQFRYQRYCKELGLDVEPTQSAKRFITDDFDHKAQIVRVQNELGKLIGTGRLNILGPTEAKNLNHLHLDLVSALYPRLGLISYFSFAQGYENSTAAHDTLDKLCELARAESMELIISITDASMADVFEAKGFKSYLASTNFMGLSPLHPRLLCI